MKREKTDLGQNQNPVERNHTNGNGHHRDPSGNVLDLVDAARIDVAYVDLMTSDQR